MFTFTHLAGAARDLGVPFPGEPGPNNAITDVAGVEVGFATLIEGMDKSLGDLMDKLKETGQWENTIIIFTDAGISFDYWFGV